MVRDSREQGELFHQLTRGKSNMGCTFRSGCSMPRGGSNLYIISLLKLVKNGTCWHGHRS